MRNSSLSTVSANRACTVITSQLYDRRALDAPIPSIPLTLSLHALAYLTSTSPRVREIVAADGGLERIVHIVTTCVHRQHAHRKGRTAANKRKPVPFRPFSAYKNGSNGADYEDIPALLQTFGFGLQCLVNVGVRGSEHIRTKVVDSGVLSVVSLVLGGYLSQCIRERQKLSRPEPSRSVTLYRPEAIVAPVAQEPLDPELAARLQNQPPLHVLHAEAAALLGLRARASSDGARTAHHTPTHSATSVTQQTDDLLRRLALYTPSSQAAATAAPRPPHAINRTNTPDTVASLDEAIDSDLLANEGESCGEESSNSATENDNDAEGDIEMDSEGSNHAARTHRRARGRRSTLVANKPIFLGAPSASSSRSSSTTPMDVSAPTMARPDTITMNTHSHISNPRRMDRDDDGDVIMSLSARTVMPHSDQHTAPDQTPVGTVANLEEAAALATPLGRLRNARDMEHDNAEGVEMLPATGQAFEAVPPLPSFPGDEDAARDPQARAQAQAIQARLPSASTALGGAEETKEFRFKDDDVLHCLHLLAYLSKYPHVRAVFHDPQGENAEEDLEERLALRAACEAHSHSHAQVDNVENMTDDEAAARKRMRCENGEASPSPSRTRSGSGGRTHRADQLYELARGVQNLDTLENAFGSSSRRHHGHSHSHSHAEGDAAMYMTMDEQRRAMRHAARERERDAAQVHHSHRKPPSEPLRPPRSTAHNVFSLVEQFTYRPSAPSERSLILPVDIQHWAGVVMRNACRKDEARGGIRQCANMACGVWERFPREFAKCRRCRKAKYCSKGCQRRAWQAGHRYWCSSRADVPVPDAQPSEPTAPHGQNDNVAIQPNTAQDSLAEPQGQQELGVISIVM